jgi:heme-degrading monooxygenase HmoA
MFAVVYLFKVKENRQSEFINTWKQLTQLIYEYEGSLGSRLHKQSDDVYLAYAQWPDRETWEHSGKKLPDAANKIRETMSACCTKIETLYELNCIEDLLKSETNQNKA